MPDALRQGGFEAPERFFAMPVDKCMACRTTAARQIRGYPPLGDTKRPGIPADLKESFDMGFPLAADDPDVRAGLPFHSTNAWPADLPGFRRAIEALSFSKLECGRHVLRAMALALGADENFFVGQCEKPCTNMRLVHSHERYSIPQFHHPSYRAVVDPAQLSGAGTIRYEPVVAGEFVAHGLQRDRKSWSEAAAETARAA